LYNHTTHNKHKTRTIKHKAKNNRTHDACTCARVFARLALSCMYCE
jgi:hypothetical protein